MNTSNRLYSLKMRASQQDSHISGAENIVPEERLQECCAALLQRALGHSKGRPDFINLKIEAVSPEDILVLPALPVQTHTTATPQEGLEVVRQKLLELGIERADEIIAIWRQSYAMRGAMLLDVHTLERLEPDPARGVRATYMDELEPRPAAKAGKNHYNEALVLATKVTHHSNIAAELCISDDPDYVTGYIAAKELGYVRVTTLKPAGSPDGGRVFLFDGKREDLPGCIEYLQRQKVLVKL